MSDHKFRIGETVTYVGGFGAAGDGAEYKITQLLPFEGDEQQYRIKGVSEPYERVARESQLYRE